MGESNGLGELVIGKIFIDYYHGRQQNFYRNSKLIEILNSKLFKIQTPLESESEPAFV